MRRLLCIVWISIVVLAPRAASANEFRAIYDRGMKLFADKEYAAARREFQRAYALRPEPVILFNIAQTFRKEGNAHDAVTYYQRFLAEPRVSEELRREAEQYKQKLEAELRAEEERASAEATEEERKPEEAQPGPEETAGEPATMTLPPPADRPRPSRRKRIPLVSWIAIGVAGVAVGSAVAFGVLGLQAESDLQADPMPTQDDIDRVERYETLTNVSWVVAATGVATAVVAYLVADNPDSNSSVTAIPLPEGGFAAIVRTRF